MARVETVLEGRIVQQSRPEVLEIEEYQIVEIFDCVPQNRWLPNIEWRVQGILCDEGDEVGGIHVSLVHEMFFSDHDLFLAGFFFFLLVVLVVFAFLAHG